MEEKYHFYQEGAIFLGPTEKPPYARTAVVADAVRSFFKIFFKQQEVEFFFTFDMMYC